MGYEPSSLVSLSFFTKYFKNNGTSIINSKIYLYK